ncbi:MAG: hypothetical protein LN568_00815 [Rickettsia endosymbiont of Pseudomimeciton antennatum]|nr:hypothetical protein [Rickettsia endosymbiont of Pseudomimeciton antennatum]
MAKIKITEEERNSYISNKSFLEHVFTYAISAGDKKTLELLNSKCPNFKPKDLFKELMYLVTNDKHEKIVKLIINKFDISLSQQRDSRNATLLNEAAVYGTGKITIPNLQSHEEKENAKFYEGMTNFYKGILSDGNQVEWFVRAINSIKTFLNELPISYDTRDFACESLWALAKLYEYYKYKDFKGSNKLQKYIIDKAEAWELYNVLSVLYNIICIEYLVVADYSKACEYAKLAYDSSTTSETKVPNTISKEMQHVLLFNLGLAWEHLDVTKSSQYFAQAEGVKPNDNALDKINKIIDTVYNH